MKKGSKQKGLNGFTKIPYRQGDVGIVATAIPAKAKPVEVKGSLVLAYGEVTGHSHTIDELKGVEVFEHEGTRYLKVGKTKKTGGTMRHQEHGAIKLKPGEYEIRIQKEYSPEEVRNVAD